MMPRARPTARRGRRRWRHQARLVQLGPALLRYPQSVRGSAVVDRQAVTRRLSCGGSTSVSKPAKPQQSRLAASKYGNVSLSPSEGSQRHLVAHARHNHSRRRGITHSNSRCHSHTHSQSQRHSLSNNDSRNNSHTHARGVP